MTILYLQRVHLALLAPPQVMEVSRSLNALLVLLVHFLPRLAHLHARIVLLALHLWPAQHRVQLVQPASILQEQVVHA